MGNYSTQEYIDMFGGLPERGETYPDDPDALREQLEEQERECTAYGAAGEVLLHDEPCPMHPDAEMT